MACYRPLIGVDLGYDEYGKRQFKVLPHNANVSRWSSGYRYIDIPCGHCIGCRAAQAKEWSNRLLLESLYHDKAYFITLTLCSEYAIKVPSFDYDTGEYTDKETLCKKDVQDFIKRLRKKFNKSKFRYYSVGEYGPRSGKAHYHMILFCDFAAGDEFDLIPAGVNENGQPKYESKVLESLWIHTDQRADRTQFPLHMNMAAMAAGKSSDLLGWCSLSPANYYTMQYVAQYCQKKLGETPNSYYEYLGILPPFSLCSRKPGIGYQYLEDHPECMQDDVIYVGQPQGVVEFMPSKYFRKKTAEYDPGLYDEISEKHILAASSRFEQTLRQTDLDEEQYNKLLEDARIKKKGLRDKI